MNTCPVGSPTSNVKSFISDTLAEATEKKNVFPHVAAFVIFFDTA
jgi:hypothetical protein